MLGPEIETKVYRRDWMPTVVQVEIDGRILAWLAGYVWDLGLFDDDVVHGGAGTCTPQHWSKRHSTHVRRFEFVPQTVSNTLAAFDMRHNTPRMGSGVTRAFWECLHACHGGETRFAERCAAQTQYGGPGRIVLLNTLLLSSSTPIGDHPTHSYGFLKFEGRTAPKCRV